MIGLDPESLARRLRAIQHMVRSRSFWFVLERYASTGFGFALTASLTRVTPLVELAQYLAAFALASTFEPLFAASINGYLLGRLRLSKDDDEMGRMFRSTYWLMQGAAVVFVAAIIGLQWSLPGDHLLVSLFFLQIAFTPLKLFTAPLIARDRFIEVKPVQVGINVLGGCLRVGVALTSHNLLLITLLLCVEPILTSAILGRRAGVRLFARPMLSPAMAKQIAKQLPVLMGAMGLVCLFYRSPVMLAQLRLGPADVVHIALAMQVLTGLGIVQGAITDSLLGPLAASISDERRFRSLLEVGSTVSISFGLIIWIGVAITGEWVLTFVFGHRAAGVGPIVATIAPICLLGGLFQLSTSVINLLGRPVLLLLMWGAVLAGQALVGLALVRWPTPLDISIGTPLSLMLGLSVALLAPRLRPLVMRILFGVFSIIGSPSLRREVVSVMLGASPTANLQKQRP